MRNRLVANRLKQVFGGVYVLASLVACTPEDELPVDRTDLDFDGVLDIHDRCIGPKETWNHFKDADGCPDEAPEPPPRRLDVGGKIQFRGGGDVIARSSYPLLDGVVDALKSNPAIHLRIEGHTDNVGSDAANLTLSRKRAEAVEAYLVRKGVSPGRLTAVGFGSSRPIAPNDTEEGRNANRRVEFNVVGP